MSWIKIQTTLIDDPAVWAIAERTKLNEFHVVGCLVAIWSWADNLTKDGFVPLGTMASIDRRAGKKGFAEAMVCVGWLEIEDHGIIFPKWDRHNGLSAKARAGESEAKRLSRSGVRRGAVPVNASALNSDKPTGQMSGQNRDKCADQRRGEEIRGEENTNTPQPPAGEIGGGGVAPTESETDQAEVRRSRVLGGTPRVFYPKSLDNKRFVEFFEGEWLTYLADRNHRMPSNITVDRQLAQLASHGSAETAIECLQEAIRLGFVAPLKSRPKNMDRPGVAGAPAPLMNAKEYAI